MFTTPDGKKFHAHPRSIARSWRLALAWGKDYPPDRLAWFAVPGPWPETDNRRRCKACHGTGIRLCVTCSGTGRISSLAWPL